MASLLRVTLKGSLSKGTREQIGTVRGLGLRGVGSTKVLKDTAPIRGMVMAVQHLVEVERFDGDDSLRDSARLRAARAKAANTDATD